MLNRLSYSATASHVSYWRCPSEERLIQGPVGEIAFVDLEADGIFALTLLLLLQQRDHHRAVLLRVERVRVAEVDEELRVRRERAWNGGTRLVEKSHVTSHRQSKLLFESSEKVD